MLTCTIYETEIKYSTPVCLSVYMCIKLNVISITRWCIHQLTLDLYDVEDYSLWCQQPYFVELLLFDGSEQKHNYVDIVTIIGIGNKSVSHDLYLSIHNMIWYIHVMSKATSCFFICRHIVVEL